MTSRDRVLAALRHKEPDRVPFDLGSTPTTGLHRDTYYNLKSYLGGVEGGQGVQVCEILQQEACVDEEILQKLKVDTRSIFLANAPDYWNLSVEEEDKYITFTDPFGVKWVQPKFHGLYFDMQRHPLAGTITTSDIEKLPLPDPRDLVGPVAKEVKRLSQETNSAIVLLPNDAGILERAEWVRGFKGLFIDLIANPSLACSLLDKLTAFHIEYWDMILNEVGELVQVVVEQDDLGTQDRTLISPDTYRKIIKPRHKEIFQFIKKKAPNAYVFLHSDGSIYDLIPDLIDAGVDILNPIQPSAANMDPKRLKKEFGGEITFWGGGVDTQNVLPNGTPSQVKDDVKKRIDALAPGGGFVFAAVHNIQPDVPPENIMAMWEALQEYGKY